MELARQTLKEMHDARKMPMRFAHDTRGGGVNPSYNGCFYGAGGILADLFDSCYGSNGATWIAAAFHGDGAPLSFDALRNNKKFNDEMMAWKHPWNKFQGTERTLRWVDFLMSNESPWRALHPFIHDRSPEYINNAGFIFTDLKNMPGKLYYNFLMAYRFPWELPRAFGHWLALVDGGVRPATALFIALNFTLNAKAESIDGPYDIIYPWSCLENTRLDAAKRFITGNPATVKPNDYPNNHNVRSLWVQTHKFYDEKFNEIVEMETLMLADILRIVNECIEKEI